MSSSDFQRITQLAEQLSPEEQLRLVEHLARALRHHATGERSLQDLYGIWRDRIPADFDLDAALKEMRHAWQREWTEDHAS